MNVPRLLLILVALAARAAPATAADPVVYWSRTDATPIDLNKPADRARIPADPKSAWLAHDGYKPRQKPGGPDESGADGVRWLQKVVVLANDQKESLLGTGRLGDNTLKVLGWTPKTSLVTETAALREGVSTLYLKALLINSEKYAKANKDLEPAPLRLAPDPAARPLEPIRFFRIFFVWGDTNPASDTDGFLLIGADSNFNDLRAAHRDVLDESSGIIGWVPKERVLLWRTREAVMWDTESTNREPVKAYKTAEDAKKAFAGQVVATDTREGDFVDGKPVPWAKNRPRHPIIPVGVDKDNRPVLAEALGAANLYKIAYIGDLISGQQFATTRGEELARVQQELAYVRAELDLTELMFVIDDSDSMDPWHPRAAAAVEQLITRVQKDGRKLRVGVTYYSDVPVADRAIREKLEKAVVCKPLVAAGTKAYTDMLEELKVHKTRPGFEGGDPPEQMYLGLQLALDNGGWSPGRARRLLVLIGDTGDHMDNGGQRKPEQAAARRLLREGQSPIEFFAFHVTAAAVATDKDVAKFKSQTEEIAEAFNAGLKLPELRVKRYFPIGGQDEMVKTVLAQYDRLAQRAAQLDAQLRKIQNGQFNAQSVSQFNDPELLEILRQKKIDLATLASGVQVFDFRYVYDATPKGVSLVRQQLLVSEHELLQVYDLLGRLLGNRQGQPTLQEFASAIARYQEGPGKTATASTGDQSAELTLKVKHGFIFQSEILTLPPEKIRSGNFSDGGRMVTRLDKKRLLLEDLLKKCRHEYGPDNLEEGLRLVRGKQTKDASTDRSFFMDKASLTGDPAADKSLGSEAGGAQPPGEGNLREAWYWLDYKREWP